MDFHDDSGQAAWRAEVRTFLEREKDAIPRDLPGEGSFRNPTSLAWRRKLASKGWIAAAWPKEYGGGGLGVMEQFVMNEEFAEAEVSMPFDAGVSLIGPTLIVHGSEAQRREHLQGILSGETFWCQGFSEPGSGSDLASLQTKAVRDGDDWVINGQKIWTTSAHEADWIFMLARTDPDAPKHRGISMFLIDMHTPGLSYRPLINMAGLHGFNETFFEDVRVPAPNMVGDVNRGWYISTTTLDFERSAVGNAVGARKSIEASLRFLREQRKSGTAISPSVRYEFAERWVEAGVAKLSSFRVATMQARGEVPNYEASIAKLFTSELQQRISRTVLKAVGMAGLLAGSPTAPLGGHAGERYVYSVCATIAGGTSEIQRNIVATRGLGLPRG